MTLVFEGIGDGKIRVTASAWPEAEGHSGGAGFPGPGDHGQAIWVTRA